MTTIEQDPTTLVLPNYTLNTEHRAALLDRELDLVSGLLTDDKTNIVIVDTDHPLSNYVRSIEAEKLPVVPALIGDAEASSKFVIVLQDQEDGITPDLAAHVFRINQHKGLFLPDDKSGLAVFDDAIESNKVTVEQLLAYYNVDSLPELGRKYINVESNIAVEGVRPSIKKPYSALGYRAIFELVREEDFRGIVACQNIPAMKSLGHLGIQSHPLVGDPTITLDYKSMFSGDDSAETGPFYPLTVESTPWSKLIDGSAENNYRVFTDPEYADSVSRLAGLVARKAINIINIR